MSINQRLQIFGTAGILKMRAAVNQNLSYERPKNSFSGLKLCRAL